MANIEAKVVAAWREAARDSGVFAGRNISYESLIPSRSLGESW
jgi:hypothetical protein